MKIISALKMCLFIFILLALFVFVVKLIGSLLSLFITGITWLVMLGAVIFAFFVIYFIIFKLVYRNSK